MTSSCLQNQCHLKDSSTLPSSAASESTALALFGPPLLCTDPEETLPRRFCLGATGLLLIITGSLAPAGQNHRFLLTILNGSNRDLVSTSFPSFPQQPTKLWTFNGFSDQFQNLSTIFPKICLCLSQQYPMHMVPISVLVGVSLAVAKHYDKR